MAPLNVEGLKKRALAKYEEPFPGRFQLFDNTTGIQQGVRTQTQWQMDRAAGVVGYIADLEAKVLHLRHQLEIEKRPKLSDDGGEEDDIEPCPCYYCKVGTELLRRRPVPFNC